MRGMCGETSAYLSCPFILMSDVRQILSPHTHIHTTSTIPHIPSIRPSQHSRTPTRKVYMLPLSSLVDPPPQASSDLTLSLG